MWIRIIGGVLIVADNIAVDYAKAGGRDFVGKFFDVRETRRILMLLWPIRGFDVGHIIAAKIRIACSTQNQVTM